MGLLRKSILAGIGALLLLSSLSGCIVVGRPGGGGGDRHWTGWQGNGGEWNRHY